MCADELLSKLRCAECRQIEFERSCDVVLKAGLMLSVGCLFVNLLTRRDDYYSAVEKSHRHVCRSPWKGDS